MPPRGLLAVVAALAIGGCGPSPTTAPTEVSPTATTAMAGTANLRVSGSGLLCYRWYEGCAAYLSVVAADWSLPNGWAASPDDTAFEGDVVDSSEAVEITGVRRAGRERIDRGSYRLVVIKTTSPDSGPSVGVITASVLCWVDLQVAPDTTVVDVDVAFDSTCSIKVASSDATPGTST